MRTGMMLQLVPLPLRAIFHAIQFQCQLDFACGFRQAIQSTQQCDLEVARLVVSPVAV